jgi:hypothetical protein
MKISPWGRAIQRALEALSLCLPLSSFASAQVSAAAATLTSPDHRVEIRFSTMHGGKDADSGHLSYSLYFEGRPLIENSG